MSSQLQSLAILELLSRVSDHSPKSFINSVHNGSSLEARTVPTYRPGQESHPEKQIQVQFPPGTFTVELLTNRQLGTEPRSFIRSTKEQNNFSCTFNFKCSMLTSVAKCLTRQTDSLSLDYPAALSVPHQHHMLRAKQSLWDGSPSTPRFLN